MKAPGQRLRADLLLMLAALLWGSAFVPQRIATDHLEYFLFNGLRFLLGGALLFPWVKPRCVPQRSFFLWAAIAGSLLVVAAALQQAGLKYTTAGKSAFLTTVYVVLVPVFLSLFWREKMGWRSWVGAFIAMIGAFLLSINLNEGFRVDFGDSLEMAGAAFWALQIIVVGRAMKHVEILLFSVGQYFVAGVLSTLLGLAMASQAPDGLAEAGRGLAACWWTVVYVGVFSVAAGYTLQATGQKHAPAADAAIILSLESVFAAIFGYLLLPDEILGVQQLCGCAAILGACFLVQDYGTKTTQPARTS